MKNKDFTNAARNVVINEQHITKLKEHLEKAEKEFQAKARAQAPTQTFYLELTAFKSLFYL